MTDDSTKTHNSNVTSNSHGIN